MLSWTHEECSRWEQGTLGFLLGLFLTSFFVIETVERKYAIDSILPAAIVLLGFGLDMAPPLIRGFGGRRSGFYFGRHNSGIHHYHDHGQNPRNRSAPIIRVGCRRRDMWDERSACSGPIAAFGRCQDRGDSRCRKPPWSGNVPLRAHFIASARDE